MFLYILAMDELISFDQCTHVAGLCLNSMVRGYFSVGELVLFPLCVL